jgi:hypothetical protein
VKHTRIDLCAHCCAQQLTCNPIIQKEFDERPAHDCGLVAHVGVLDPDETAEDASGVTAPVIPGGSARRLDHMRNLSVMSSCTQPSLAFADIRNGTSELLYAPLQQHLPKRKCLMIWTLEAEVAAIRQDYNKKFDAVSAKKEATVHKIEGNLDRVKAIQTELGMAKLPSGLDPTPDEDEGRHVRVDTHELTTSEWLYPAKR